MRSWVSHNVIEMRGFGVSIVKCCDALVSGANAVPSRVISGPSGDPWLRSLPGYLSLIRISGLVCYALGVVLFQRTS